MLSYLTIAKYKYNNNSLNDMYNNLAIIIPTLNEAENIGKLIPLLKKQYPKAEIIIADDGSTDSTKEIAGKKAILIDRTNESIHGLCASVIDSIKYTKRKFFVVIDADLQHPPGKIKELVNALSKGNVLVVGKRVKIKEEWPLARRIISKTATLLGRIRLLNKNFKCSDIVSGFFAGRTSLIKKIISEKEQKFEKKGYKVLFDILKYLPKDAKVREVPYAFSIRTKGSSKLSKKIIFYYFRSLLK